MTETRPQLPGQAARTIDHRNGPASPEQIEAQIEVTREHLAATIDHITDRVSPRNVARRTGTRLRSTVLDERGHPRTVRIAVLAVATASVVAFGIWQRRHR